MGKIKGDGWRPSPQEKVKNPARLGAQRGCSKVKRDSLPRGNGGGVAPPDKPSELGWFLLQKAASEKCGIHKPHRQFIRGRTSDLSQAPGLNSNPNCTLEPPSAFFQKLAFWTKTRLHGVPPTLSEGNSWTPNIWDKNNWLNDGASAKPVLSAGAPRALARCS